MLYKILNHILKKSPWEDLDEEENIFTKQRRKNNFNFDNFQFNQFHLNSKIIFFVLCGLFGLWLSSGIYEIKEGEEGAVIRFGKFVRKSFPGLNYRLPTPIETVVIEKVNKSRRIEIGYRSGKTSTSSKSMLSESTMLTGDENIVDLNCDIMWHINDLAKFVFNVVDPEEAVKTAAESAVREVISNTPISSILSNQKQEITDKIEVLTQKILDNYGVGVVIEKVQLLKAEPPAEVIDAYRDVQTARADKEREINEALAYNNDILPKARGEAAKILQEAEGYKQEVIAKAEGDTKRFAAVYAQYANNKELTRSRLYLETIENVLSGPTKTIIGTNIMLPHMAIPQK